MISIVVVHENFWVDGREVKRRSIVTLGRWKNVNKRAPGTGRGRVPEQEERSKARRSLTMMYDLC